MYGQKKRYGLPLLLEVNAPLREERSRHDQLVLKNLARWSERYCWRNADYVLPVTAVLANRVRAEGVDMTRIEVIHNAINAEAFQNAPSCETAKQRLGVERQDSHRLRRFCQGMAWPGPGAGIRGRGTTRGPAPADRR